MSDQVLLEGLGDEGVSAELREVDAVHDKGRHVEDLACEKERQNADGGPLVHGIALAVLDGSGIGIGHDEEA